MDIAEVKAAVTALWSQQGRRMPVYDCLRSAWHDSRSEDMTVLVMQQMLFCLMDLQYPWRPSEGEQEYDLYVDFLHEAIAYGFAYHRQGKKFLWYMCYYLYAWSTYHYIFGEQLPQDRYEEIKVTLLSTASRYYPTSVLFDLIPTFHQGETWRHKVSEAVRQVVLGEIQEFLPSMTDPDILPLFAAD